MKNTRQLFTCTALFVSVLALTGCGGGSGGDSGPAVSTAPAGSAAIILSNGQVARSIVGGSGLPAASLGVDGDYFLDMGAGRLFGPKAGGAWPVASLLLVGPAGPAGATGAVGPTGPVGPGGSSGVGPGLYSGTAVPSSTLGRDGDFYLNFTDRMIVGPKAGGLWPNTGISVIGPAGATGAVGATGATGAAGTSLLSGAGTPNNAMGGNGDYYINTSNNSLIGPKNAGVWPLLGISLVGPAGQMGATGAAGTTGFTGPAGVPGATGATGTPGINGTAGPAGTSVLAGAGAPAGALGNVGDLYFDSTARTLIGPKTGAGWPLGGTALNGSNGTTGANGTNGTNGINGANGANGANGTNGRTILSAATNPVPGDGLNGDFFINTGTSTLFGPKAGGAWPPGVLLIGTNGANGLNGATGATGRTILNGTGNPGGGDGADGDFFINTASSQLFGPKAAGTWPAGVTLVGPAGANGKTILNGSSDPVNATGTNGDFFINITTNTLFGPKNAGAWPTGVSLVGPAAGVVAPEIFACATGATTVVTPASNATRTLFCNFNGSIPGIPSTRVNLVLPAASTYASGTVITFRTTGTISSFGSPDIKGIPLQFFFQSAGSTYTGSSLFAANNRNNVSTTVAIELVNGEGALLSVMAVGTRWYQLSP